MDIDNMKKWSEFAKQFQHGPFWDGVFDADSTKQLMQQFPTPSINKTPSKKFPLADVIKSTHEIIVLVDLPGIRKEDVELSVMDDSLYLKGVSNPFYPSLQNVQAERFIGQFERTISLSEKLGSGTKISAKFDNGMLEIRIPRSQRPKETIRIE